MSFVGELAKVFDKLGPYPNLSAWLSRMHARPAFKRSIEKGGAYRFVRGRSSQPQAASFRDAPLGAGPEIHNPGSWLWIHVSSRSARPGMTSEAVLPGPNDFAPTDLPDRLFLQTPVNPRLQKYFCFTESQITLYS